MTGLSDAEWGKPCANSLRIILDLQQVVEIRTAPGCHEFDRVIRVSDLLAVITQLEEQS